MDSGIPQYWMKNYWPLYQKMMKTAAFKDWWKSELDLFKHPRIRKLFWRVDRLKTDIFGKSEYKRDPQEQCSGKNCSGYRGY